jgi:hypothetical protein
MWYDLWANSSCDINWWPNGDRSFKFFNPAIGIADPAFKIVSVAKSSNGTLRVIRRNPDFESHLVTSGSNPRSIHFRKLRRSVFPGLADTNYNLSSMLLMPQWDSAEGSYPISGLIWMIIISLRAPRKAFEPSSSEIPPCVSGIQTR